MRGTGSKAERAVEGSEVLRQPANPNSTVERVVDGLGAVGRWHFTRRRSNALTSKRGVDGKTDIMDANSSLLATTHRCSVPVRDDFELEESARGVDGQQRGANLGVAARAEGGK